MNKSLTFTTYHDFDFEDEEINSKIPTRNIPYKKPREKTYRHYRIGKNY